MTLEMRDTKLFIDEMDARFKFWRRFKINKLFVSCLMQQEMDVIANYWKHMIVLLLHPTNTENCKAYISIHLGTMKQNVLDLGLMKTARTIYRIWYFLDCWVPTGKIPLSMCQCNLASCSMHSIWNRSQSRLLEKRSCSIDTFWIQIIMIQNQPKIYRECCDDLLFIAICDS